MHQRDENENVREEEKNQTEKSAAHGTHASEITPFARPYGRNGERVKHGE